MSPAMPRARLYSLVLSHPGHAARLMLERKGIDYAPPDGINAWEMDERRASR
jgi:hypothetical protein